MLKTVLSKIPIKYKLMGLFVVIVLLALIAIMIKKAIVVVAIITVILVIVIFMVKLSDRKSGGAKSD